jgi:hypothetical protein
MNITEAFEGTTSEILKRIQVSFFEGSHYWEVCIDGKQITTFQTKREADMFVAEIILRMT